MKRITAPFQSIHLPILAMLIGIQPRPESPRTSAFNMRSRRLCDGSCSGRRRAGWAMLLLALASGILKAPQAAAGTVFFGPTPYRSAADSPFDLSGLGSDFFLEDFEDGALNTPGIILGDIPRQDDGEVLGPGPETDSVDADDGAIDGQGSAGHSFATQGGRVLLSDPPVFQRTVIFEFDRKALGRFPTAFGFVWTDGPPELTLLMEVTDGNGELHQYASDELLGDSGRDGGTADDRFFGVTSTAGISRIVIAGTTVGNDQMPPAFMEIDHVQYGTSVVPEPSAGITAIVFVAIGLSCFEFSRRRRIASLRT